MNNAAKSLIPDGYTVYILKISKWTAKRNLQSSDSGLDKQITKRLASLGTMNTFDDEALKPFRNWYLKAHSLCNQFGIKFGDGYLFPLSKVSWLESQLTQLSQAWQQLSVQIVSSYENELRAWAVEAEKEVEGFGEIILQRAFTKEYVANQLQFKWVTLDEEMRNLGTTYIEEIAATACDKQAAIEKKMQKLKESKKPENGFLTRFDMRFYDSIVDKMRANTLLDPSINVLLAEVDAVYNAFNNIPEKDAVSDHSDFVATYLKTLSILANPNLVTASYKGNGKAAHEEFGDIAMLSFADEPNDDDNNSNTVVEAVEKPVLDNQPTKELPTKNLENIEIDLPDMGDMELDEIETTMNNQNDKEDENFPDLEEIDSELLCGMF